MSSTSPNSPSAVTFAQFADSWIPEPEPVEAARERARECTPPFHTPPQPNKQVEEPIQ